MVVWHAYITLARRRKQIQAPLPRGVLNSTFAHRVHCRPNAPPRCERDDNEHFSTLLNAMAPQCDPLCQFGDRFVHHIQLLVRWLNSNIARNRLYFTTFPHPAPLPHVLNRPAQEKTDKPRVRSKLNSRGSPATPDEDALYYYFTIDHQLLYLSFFKDWGPLNLAMVYKACILIHELLEVCHLL